MYMESEYILIVLEMCAHLSKIIVIKHRELTMNKSKIEVSRLS